MTHTSHQANTIIEVDSISTVLQLIKAHPNQSIMVLFDLDNTLIRSSTYLSSPEFSFARLKDLKTDITSPDEAYLMMLGDFVYLSHYDEMVLVEESSPQILNELKNQQISCLGLTGRNLDLAMRTRDVLDSLELRFNQVLQERRIFRTSPYPIMYQDGVLFCSMLTPKPVGVKQILAACDRAPEVIIMVDDDQKELAVMSQFAHSQNFIFYGLRLNACDKLVVELDYTKIANRLKKFRSC